MLELHARRALSHQLIASSIAWALLRARPPIESTFSFYDERVQPILSGGCQRQSTGCHVDDGSGFALGNLDLSSYDGLLKRADTLSAYGPYPVGLLLLKAGDPVDINVRTVDAPDPENPDAHYVRITTDIRHAAGEGAIAEGSSDYAALKQWIERGYSRDGVARDFPGMNRGECSGGVARVPGMDLAAEPTDRDSYESFVDNVQPISERALRRLVVPRRSRPQCWDDFLRGNQPPQERGVRMEVHADDGTPEWADLRARVVRAPVRDERYPRS